MECGMGQEKCTRMQSGVTGFEGSASRVREDTQGCASRWHGAITKGLEKVKETYPS